MQLASEKHKPAAQFEFPGHIESSAETTGKLQDSKKQMSHCCRGELFPPTPSSRHDVSVEKGIYDWGPECITVAAERRLLSHRSGDLPPISMISDRMEGEGSASGGGGGLLRDLFPVKMMMVPRRSKLKAHTER